MKTPLVKMKIAFVVLVSSVLASFAEPPPATPPIVPTNLDEVKTIQEPCPRSDSVQPKRYMIQWDDGPSIDGNYILVVHPTQILLRSSHENPNPNFVYWVMPVDSAQYEALVRFLDSYQGKALTNHKKVGWWIWPGYAVFRLENPKVSPWDFGESRKKEWAKASDAAVNSNVQRILRELNRAFGASGKKLAAPVYNGRKGALIDDRR